MPTNIRRIGTRSLEWIPSTDGPLQAKRFQISNWESYHLEHHDSQTAPRRFNASTFRFPPEHSIVGNQKRPSSILSGGSMISARQGVSSTACSRAIDPDIAAVTQALASWDAGPDGE